MISTKLIMSQIVTRSKKRSLESSSQESLEFDKQSQSSQSPVKKIRLKNVTNIETNKKTDSKITQDNKMIDSQSGEISLKQASQTTQTQRSQTSQVIEQLKCIKASLEDSYKNVTERLCLESIPLCFYTLKDCARTHSTRQMQPTISLRVEIVAKQLLDEEHYLQFISYARDCILSRRAFPGIEVIKGIYEAIMVSGEKEKLLRFFN